MAKPISEELTIEWGSENAQPKLFPPRENQLYVVIDKRQTAARVAELRLRPVGPVMRYWPGQYVTLGDERAEVPPRAYSIANAPRPDGEIVLQVALAEGGRTSEWVHETVAVGDNLKLSGPYGTFIGDPSVDTPVLCLAAGTGLAPILALAEAALRRGFKQKVMVVISARTAEDVYAQGMLAWWRAKHRNFDYRITLTRETAEGYAHGRIDTLLPTLFKDLSTHSVFAAGSPDFVDACVAAAKARGASEAMIHTEGFFAQQTLPQVDG